jgi:type VI secretion system secreted protein Hcp
MTRALAVKLGALLASAAGAAGTTYVFTAAGSAATGVIDGCVNREGHLRIVGAAGRCRHEETPISWNVVGPVGPAGPTGASGPSGRDGATGPTGPQGTAGAASGVAADPGAVAATIAVTGQRTGAFSAAPLEVLAVSHGISSPRDAQSGLPTGRRQHKALVVSLPWSAATPLFINALTTNENLKTVTLSLLGDHSPAATLALTNASVAEYTHTGPTVTFSFTYQKIEWTWLDGNIAAADDWEAMIP